MSLPRPALLAITVAALGYLVDIYDLILFSVVRVPSLTDIGVPEDARLSTGLYLLNMQMIGMLVGGVVWGVLGDRRGRLSVLFGSILMYSLANIANGFVTDVDTYAILRLLAGIGLAGELGAGITLVTELLPPQSRGWATTAVAGIGICGALLAVVVSWYAEWRVAYWIGGVLGLLLLVLRIGVAESGMFKKALGASAVPRGNFFALFSTRQRALRYLSIVACGVPIWYAVGILVTAAPELGGALGLDPRPNAGTAVMCCYTGLAIGDFASGWLSQLVKSRKTALFSFVSLNIVAIAFYFVAGPASVEMIYVACFVLGIANGYWAVFVTVAAEQFGTNLRATATTTAPNFVRGSLVPVSIAFQALVPAAGHVGAAVIVGAAVVTLALVSLLGIEETYGKDLDFHES